MIAKKLFPSADNLIRAIKGSTDAPALDTFQDLAAQHVNEVCLLHQINFLTHQNKLKVFPLDDDPASEANLILMLVLVTSMNQYDAPEIMFEDDERPLSKRKRHQFEYRGICLSNRCFLNNIFFLKIDSPQSERSFDENDDHQSQYSSGRPPSRQSGQLLLINSDYFYPFNVSITNILR